MAPSGEWPLTQLKRPVYKTGGRERDWLTEREIKGIGHSNESTMYLLNSRLCKDYQVLFYMAVWSSSLMYNSIMFSYYYYLFIMLCLFVWSSLSVSFSSHWPALAGAVYSSHSDSVFADQTQDHRKVFRFPSLLSLSLVVFSCVPSFSLIILLFIPLLYCSLF